MHCHDVVDPDKIVFFDDKIWSLCNRRLKIFKDAGVEKVFAKVQNFSTATVRAEFFDKLCPKSVV